MAENDVSAVAEYVPGFEETRSEMCLPLISLGETLGVMTLESAQPNAFTPADAQPLESVADICAAAIQNARYFEQSQASWRTSTGSPASSTGVTSRRESPRRSSARSAMATSCR